MSKPVVGFIAGRTAPPGKRMGHAGAVVSGGGDTAEAKMQAMREAGIAVCEGPHLLGQAMKDALSRSRRAARGAGRRTAHAAPAARKGRGAPHPGSHGQRPAKNNRKAAKRERR